MHARLTPQYRRRTLNHLLNTINASSDPSILRSDHEHARQQRRYRRALEALYAHYNYKQDWTETESGRYISRRTA